MQRLLADENVEVALVQAIRRDRQVDIVRAQDAGLSGVDDSTLLAWAAANDRVVITHDLDTMPRDALVRVEAGLPMGGVIAIPQPYNIGKAAEELTLLAHCSREGEWARRIAYLSR